MPSKLIRDRIPVIAEAAGQKLEVRKIRPHEWDGLLRAKVGEEAAEVQAASKEELLDEIADLVEVAAVLARHHGWTEYDVLQARVRKTRERGSFWCGYVLTTEEQS
ncbi:nucleoside triphosphate pyrophosphohydrolase [Streptomyces katrae]|uniref:nucleoside triphosphate pyrophosphohydrolase n=1 Tax=Streptomyces katrae TaxID=68223 RepID=UPI0004C00A1E|nr:nucleoside triphosphate pyrophosphohydrolase [Streptomyces katrae]